MRNVRIRTALLALFLLLFAAAPGLRQPASAESGRITFTDPTVQLGNSAAVYMSIKAGNYNNYNVASVDITLSYDTEYLQFVSASEGMGNLSCSAGSGTLHITDRVNSGTSSFGCYLHFNTLKAGTTKITVKSNSTSVLDRNGSRFSMSYGSSTVVINDVLSGATLDSLSLKGLELYPGFESRTMNYGAYAPFEVKEVEIQAQPTRSGSSFRVTGNKELVVGTNEVKVSVTAEDGSTTVYQITVTRLAEGEEIPSSPPPITITATGEGKTTPSSSSRVVNRSGETIIMYVTDSDGLSLMSFTDDVIPPGFTRASFDYEDVVVPCCVYTNAPNVKRIVYLYKEGTQGPPSFYYFNEETNRCSAMAVMQSGSYSIMDMLDIYECPEGYRDGTYMIGGASYKVFTPKDVDIPNHYIVCAINNTGLYGLYVYDITEGTLQRFNFMQLAAAEVVEEGGEENGEGDGEGEKQLDTTFKGLASLLRAIGLLDDDRRLSRFISALLLLIFFLFVLVAVLLYVMNVRSQKRRRELKFNVPPVSVHAEALEREAAQARLERREARKARAVEKRETRLARKARRAEKRAKDTPAPPPPQEELRDTAGMEAIPGLLEKEPEEESDDLRIDLGQSEGSLEYDQDIQRILSELGIEEIPPGPRPRQRRGK